MLAFYKVISSNDASDDADQSSESQTESSESPTNVDYIDKP